MTPNPLVGVVTPVRNGARWLDEMLLSVREQTYSNWRLIVVDDGSEDDSLEIAQRHAASDHRIDASRRPGRGSGPFVCRNFGREALGEAPDLLYFPDADDVLDPQLLEVLIARLGADPRATAVFCAYKRMDETGEFVDVVPTVRLVPTERWSRRLKDDESVTPFHSIYGRATPAIEATIMSRTRAFDEAGRWPRARNGFGSIDLLCRLSLLGPVLFEPRPLYGYRLHPTQLTRDRKRLSKGQEAVRELWRRRARANPDVRLLVEESEFFIEHRLAVRTGLEAAWRHARSLRIVTALRFLGGAVRRYRWRHA